MKNILKLVVLFVIALVPISIVNAESKIDEVMNAIKSDEDYSFINLDYEVNGGTLIVEYETLVGESRLDVAYEVDGNVLSYTIEEINSEEEAEVATSHFMYMIGLYNTVLKLNGYTTEQIIAYEGEPTFEVNGFEFVNLGEESFGVSPMRLIIDVSKANLDGNVPTNGATIESLIETLMNDESFTKTEDDGKILTESSVSVENDQFIITTITNNYEYNRMLFDIDDDVVSYEVEEVDNYDHAVEVLQHTLWMTMLMNRAILLNGYSVSEIQAFMSDTNNSLTYELNGIEFVTGESKEFTSDDEESSSTLTISPISFKIDLAKANIKKPVTEEKEEYKILDGANQNIAKTDKLSFRVNFDFNRFVNEGKVFVDKKEVDKKYYNTSEGSTIITFTNEFVKSLSVGNHTFSASLSDGSVSTGFTITKSNNPATGDNIMLYGIISMLSFIGIVVARSFKKINN